MAKRTTRNKIRLHADTGLENLEKSVSQLMIITQLADGKSEVINKLVPPLVYSLEMVQDIYRSFRDKL